MAHVAMGILRRLQNRLSESKMEFETAIALDRSNARAIFQLGQTMVWLSQPEAGIPLLKKAIRLNPHDPTHLNARRSAIDIEHPGRILQAC
jgi:tetratricopeptide (TPR) repeat protein